MCGAHGSVPSPNAAQAHPRRFPGLADPLSIAASRVPADWGAALGAARTEPARPIIGSGRPRMGAPCLSGPPRAEGPPLLERRRRNALRRFAIGNRWGRPEPIPGSASDRSRGAGRERGVQSTVDLGPEMLVRSRFDPSDDDLRGGEVRYRIFVIGAAAWGRSRKPIERFARRSETRSGPSGRASAEY
jgi:hypothetical protein